MDQPTTEYAGRCLTLMKSGHWEYVDRVNARNAAMAATALIAFPLGPLPGLGQDFFPSVDAGQLKLHFRASSGLRIEQINKELGTTTRDLALPIRKLIAEGHLHTKGEKRATTYFAGEGGGGRGKRSKKN